LRITCANSKTRNSRPITAAILTAGCRLNQSESDALRQKLLQQGVRLVRSPEDADVCYVNTCTVTAAADRSSVQLVRRARRGCGRVVVLGCMAERDPDRVLAVGATEAWPNARKQQELAGSTPAPVRSRALLKVQDGCPRRCAYCVVSGLRGTPWSMPAATAVRQFLRLAEQGFNEVVLTGLNLGLYDSDETRLDGLIKQLLAAVPGPRIRIGSIEPDTVGPGLVAVLREPRVCAHLHLPLQSGDDVILQRMHRPYAVSGYRQLVESLRTARPDINIGADVIAGFPGETDASFELTMEFLQQVPVTYLHAFAYSPRPGTVAEPGPRLPSAVVKDRVHRLRAFSAARRAAYERGFAGSVRPAIVEAGTSALTDNYIKVRLTCGPVRPKTLVNLRLEADGDRLTGRPI
jgi:threonylcarbamoyladenosine tRNA methylthiotransferase MtaB